MGVDGLGAEVGIASAIAASEARAQVVRRCRGTEHARREF